MTGLSMLCFSAYAILKNLCDTDANGLKYIYGRSIGPTPVEGAHDHLPATISFYADGSLCRLLSRTAMLSRFCHSICVVRLYSAGLRINVWDLGPGPQDGTTLIAFEARSLAEGYVSLGEGVAVIVKGKKLPAPALPVITPPTVTWPPIKTPKPSTSQPWTWSPTITTISPFSLSWWFNIFSLAFVYIPSLVVLAWFHLILSIFQPITRAVKRAA